MDDTPVAGAEDAPEDDQLGDALDGATEDAVDASGATADAPEVETPPAVEEWAAAIASAPHRINEIPAKQRGAVIEAINARNEAATAKARADYERAANIAYQKGMQDAAEQARITQAVAEIDAFRANDPQGYVEWEDAHPDRAQVYRAHKAQATPQQGQQAQVQTIATSVALIESQLRAVPGAFAAVAAKGPYQPTADGLAQLMADAADAIAEAKYAARMKASEPDQRRAQERQTNAAALKGLPKPAGTAGSGADAELTPERLLSMTQAEILALHGKPGGTEQINKAMAAHARKFA